MLIEATERPIRYKWPGGEISLVPGQPVQVDQERGLKILKKCGDKVRVPAPFKVGDQIVYQVPGDPEEGPYQVVEVLPDGPYPRWYAIVEKDGALVIIGQELIVRETP